MILVAAAATLVPGLAAGGTTLLFVASGLALAAIALVAFDAWAFGRGRGEDRPETQEPETTEPETTEPVEQDEVFDEPGEPEEDEAGSPPPDRPMGEPK